MDQLKKFYVASFLKNQTYFTPILIVFLQSQFLSFSQIFWVFTIGSLVSFVMEIPTGVLADIFGKKKTIIISRVLILVAYVVYGFSETFYMFILAQALYEFGNSFRTGTEAAYIYDYIKQKGTKDQYTKVKGNQKFYARVGEAIATAVGGVIAGQLGYNWVFFIAAVPALLNLLNAILWENIKERTDAKVDWRRLLKFTRSSVCHLCRNRRSLLITVNITIFTGVLAAMNKFVQPYMVQANIPIEYFGFIYAASLGLTALAVRYAYLFEDKFGSIRTINVASMIAVIPGVIIGFGLLSIFGVVLFFIVLIIENIRSPIANNEYHKTVKSDQRATLGSVLEQSKSLGKMVILPIAGYLSDTFSLFAAMLVLSGILAVNSVVFYLRRK